MEFRIIDDDLSGPEVHALLTAHLDFTAGESPPESRHALDLDSLRVPEISFWSAWDDDGILGCCALGELDSHHGEIKSMHTAHRYRGKGIAARLLKHVISVAKTRCYNRLSLETGSMDAFAPARALYARHGFVLCGPFANYREDPYSNFMTLELTAD